MTNDTEKAKRKLRKRRPKKLPYKPSDMLSTGSTVVDLLCSGRLEGGLVKGHYFFFVGDSGSGKTWFSMSIFAEACKNPNFREHRLIYDGAERGAMMDISRYFGTKVAERMEAPFKTEEGGSGASHTIEEFYYNLDDNLSKGPCIYVQDSMDVLSSEEEGKKFDESKEAWKSGKETAGSYGDGKAKKNSANLRKIIPKLQETGSILVIINQTRDNLGFGFKKKTRSGGHALEFYACLELWTSVKGKITKTVRKKPRQIGVRSLVKVEKNRLTGREGSAEVPIYYSFGIDDIGSCIEYLIDEGHWTKRKATINPPEFNFSGTQERLVQFIEEQNLEDELKEIVKEVWDEIEAACAVKRRSRYE